MTTPTSQARQLVSALVGARPQIVALAAREADWLNKKGELSRDTLSYVLKQLQFMGWEGEVPEMTIEEKIETQYHICYVCQNCALAIIDKTLSAPEAPIRIELDRRSRARPALHSDLAPGRCKGILVPVSLREKE